MLEQVLIARPGREAVQRHHGAPRPRGGERAAARRRRAPLLWVWVQVRGGRRAVGSCFMDWPILVLAYVDRRGASNGLTDTMDGRVELRRGLAPAPASTPTASPAGSSNPAVSVTGGNRVCDEPPSGVRDDR